MGPFPSALTVCLAEGEKELGPQGWTLGWWESRVLGGVGLGAGRLLCELLVVVKGHFYTATGTPLPRLRPPRGGPWSPPTPVMHFSGVWWRAEWPWRPSGNWRAGEASRVWVEGRVGLLQPTGPGWRVLVPELASFLSPDVLWAGGRGCLRSRAHWVMRYKNAFMPGGTGQPLERRSENLNQEGPEQHVSLSPLQHPAAPPQTPPPLSQAAPFRHQLPSWPLLLCSG